MKESKYYTDKDGKIWSRNPLTPSEIILACLIGLLIIGAIAKGLKNEPKCDCKYHIIDTPKQAPLQINGVNYWIEADTVDNTIFYRIYGNEHHHK
jgi:hypothetical protein